MVTLSNDRLRENNIREFLIAMHIDAAEIKIKSNNELFSFQLNNKDTTEQFAKQLSGLFKEENVSIHSLNLSQIIDDELAQATCSDTENLETHRASCKGILDIIKSLGSDFTFLSDSGEMEVNLPSPVYASMLGLLQYPHLKFSSNGKLVLNIQKYLSEVPKEIIKIEGLKSTQAPLVFLKANLIESKRIFYATECLADGTMRVTPYLFVPPALEAPSYHLVLDISSSMGNKDSYGRICLNSLKASVKDLAHLLFQFQPEAKVSLTVFSDTVKSLGEFSQTSIGKLYNIVDGLQANGETALYLAIAQILELITQSNGHNNVLVFTDGDDSGLVHGAEPRIKNVFTNLSPEVAARNKVHVFSYGANQRDLIQKVTQAFQSEIVNTASPDFMAAQKDPGKMKNWAATRDLFASRVIVRNQIGQTESKSNYVLTLNRSSQLASLTPLICRPGDTVSIVVTDSNNNIVVESTQEITAPLQIPSNAALMGTLGIHAARNSETKAIGQDTALANPSPM